MSACLDISGKDDGQRAGSYPIRKLHLARSNRISRNLTDAFYMDWIYILWSVVRQEVFQSAIRDTVHIEGRVYLKVS